MLSCVLSLQISRTIFCYERTLLRAGALPPEADFLHLPLRLTGKSTGAFQALSLLESLGMESTLGLERALTGVSEV